MNKSSEGQMNKHKPTQTLPGGYFQSGQLNLNENRGLAMILNLVGIGVLFGVGGLLLQSLTWLRPEYLSTDNILIITGLREFWRSVLVLVVSLGLMVVLNEGLRGVLFWIFIRQKPQLSFRGFYTYAVATDWYLPRNLYLQTRLTPVLTVTLLGLAAVPIVSLNLVPGVLLLISLNIAGALNELVTAFWLLRRPQDVLVLDQGDFVRIFQPVIPPNQEGSP
jgi:hypothetical protein